MIIFSYMCVGSEEAENLNLEFNQDGVLPKGVNNIKKKKLRVENICKGIILLMNVVSKLEYRR